MPVRDLALIVAGCALFALTPTLALAGPDDQPDTCAAAADWSLADHDFTVTGRLESAGDIDVFVLRLEPGMLYRLNHWRGDCAICPRARVFVNGSCERAAAGIDGYDTIGQDWFLGPAAVDDLGGRAYLVVDYPSGGWGNYLVRLDRLGGPFTDDHPSGVDDATPIVADGATVSGSLEFDLDVDRFVLDARPGAMYAVRAVSGIGPGRNAYVSFGPPFHEGKPMLSAQIPEDGCAYRVNGCDVARMIAPEGEPSRLYIAVWQGVMEDPTRPPTPYEFQLVDEGDFVVTPSGDDCTNAPPAPIAEPIRVALPDNRFTARTYTLPAAAVGNVYRIDAVNDVGAADYSFGVSDGVCVENGACCGDKYRNSLYLRSGNSDPKQLFVYRNNEVRDYFGLPVPGWCTLRAVDLGLVGDAEVDNGPMSAGGRIARGTLEYGGDEDTFVTEVAAGVWYRLEMRVRTPGKGAHTYAFGVRSSGSVYASGPQTPGGTPAFSSVNFLSNDGGTVHLGVAGSSSGGEIPTQYEVRMYRRDCRADWNNSGSVNAEDVFAYLADYSDGAGEFDGIGNGQSIGDLLGFVQRYFAPCE